MMNTRKNVPQYFKHFHPLILLILTQILFYPSIAQESLHVTYPVSSETMTLDGELLSRGRLGGIAIDKLGFIYVANFSESVWKVSPEGHVDVLYDGLYGGSGNTIDAEGNLLQSNFYSNTVLRIDRSGQVKNVITEGLDGPVGIEIDEQGNMIVCNCSGNFISITAPNGKTKILATSQDFDCPNGIAIHPNGDLFITNYGNDFILRIDKKGNVSRFAEIPGGQGNAHIRYLNGSFYVTKIKANGLYQITPDGRYALLTSVGIPGTADGIGSEIQLARPNGLAVDPFGKYLVVNTLNGPWVINEISKGSSISLRKIRIPTISSVFKDTLNSSGLEEAKKSYWTYKNDPLHQHEDTGVETGTLGWQLMIQRNVTAALEVFHLLAESYPKRWRPKYYLGQAYGIIGQLERSKEYYNEALKLDPKNTLVISKLKSLH